MHYALRTSVITDLAPFTSVAWDHGTLRRRLATGSVDGTVIIWTAGPPHAQPPEDDAAPVTPETTNLLSSPTLLQPSSSR